MFLHLLIFLLGLNDVSVSIDLDLVFITFFLWHGTVSKFLDHVNNLSGGLLSDDCDNLTLLKCLTIDIQRQIIRIYNTADERHVFGKQFKIVGDQDLTDVQLHTALVISHFSPLKTCGDFGRQVNQSLEVDITLSVKVRP